MPNRPRRRLRLPVGSEVSAGKGRQRRFGLLPAVIRVPTADGLQAALVDRETVIRKQKVAEEFLLTSQRYLGGTLAEMGAGLVETDGNGCVTFLNAVAEQVLGRSLDNARGQALWRVSGTEELAPWHPTAQQERVERSTQEARRSISGRHHFANWDYVPPARGR